jgi:signal transduction histidine kinase
MLNMVRNGLEAMSPGKNTTIRTFVEGNEAVLAIQNQGKGIKEDDLEKLGTPFFTTKDHGTGLGLGLAVCYSIAARHNGTAKAETGLAGTTFTSVLPSINLFVDNGRFFSREKLIFDVV